LARPPFGIGSLPTLTSGSALSMAGLVTESKIQAPLEKRPAVDFSW